ncbi:hypothetical protein E4U61_001571 [Claviceps capensis]|nr:hypothetical protein E4U61_001571 [Claviceps capensis]
MTDGAAAGRGELKWGMRGGLSRGQSSKLATQMMMSFSILQAEDARTLQTPSSSSSSGIRRRITEVRNQL